MNQQIPPGTGHDQGAQHLISESFARRAPDQAGLARAIGAGLQALAGQGFVAAEVEWIARAAAESGLGELESWDEATIARCPLVGPPQAQTPVVREKGLLYFRVNWRKEKELADRLTERIRSDLPPAATAITFPGLNAEQSGAASAAARQALTVISGGPGTGKTTTVAALIAQCVKNGWKTSDMALAAPTGKAAARLGSALGGALERVLPGTQPPAAGTLHRLLRWHPGRASFHFCAANPLPQRLVVVDEVSMVDLHLMHALVSAVAPGAALVLVGDKDQLVSVQPGSVLADIHAGLAGTSNLCNLSTTYRFAGRSGIAAMAMAVREGDADRALRELSAGHQDLVWCADLSDLAALVNPYADALAQATPEQAWDKLNSLRFLCAHRSGPAGARWLNERIARHLQLPPASATTLAAGSLFAVTGNHYAQRFFNGDQGFLWRAAGTVTALVQRADGSLRQLSPTRLPAVEPAFAMTVHRAQGSEFDRVVVQLPPADSPVLSRELLYTAVTRARSHVTLVGDESAIRAAVARPSRRGSGLAARLRQALGGTENRQGELF